MHNEVHNTHRGSEKKNNKKKYEDVPKDICIIFLNQYIIFLIFLNCNSIHISIY